MNTLINNNTPKIFAHKVWFSDDKMYLLLSDGRELGVPLAWFPKLATAPEKALSNYRFIGRGLGIHWEELDEDISVQALL